MLDEPRHITPGLFVCNRKGRDGSRPAPLLLALLELAQRTDSLLTPGTFICPIARGIADDPAAGGVFAGGNGVPENGYPLLAAKQY